MGRGFISNILILGLLFWGTIGAPSQALAYSGPATVKVNLLPVYTDTSVTSGIVKFFKKGEVVDVGAETVTSEGRWCSVKESSEKMMVGFVNCEALEFSPPPRRSAGEIRPFPPSPGIEEKRSAARLIPSIPSKEPAPIPGPGYLLQALWNEDIARVKELLAKGADPNAQTGCGTRPLLMMAKKNNPELIKILIENGAKVDGRDRNGSTPLMAAALVGQAKNVEILIDAGAEVNARDNRGLTALMWATMKGFPNIAEILLANGADVNVKTAEGLNARRLSQRIIADLQRSLGEAETAKDKDDPTRLRLARHEQVLRVLERTGGE